MHIGEALQMQIEVQRRLHEQLEVQKQHNINYIYYESRVYIPLRKYDLYLTNAFYGLLILYYEFYG